MSDIKDLYQEIIIDHSRKPRNTAQLDTVTHRAEGKNPLCGDCVRVSLKIANDKIDAIQVLNTGCAISTATASLLSDEILGVSTEEARAVILRFRDALTQVEPDPEILGRLEPLYGVREYPGRIKCVTLALHATLAALEHETKVITTE